MNETLLALLLVLSLFSIAIGCVMLAKVSAPSKKRVRDLRVGEKGKVAACYCIFVDREHNCWIDVAGELSEKIPEEFGAVEVARTEKGFIIRLLTPDYKFEPRNIFWGLSLFPVEKFEIAGKIDYKFVDSILT